MNWCHTLRIWHDHCMTLPRNTRGFFWNRQCKVAFHKLKATLLEPHKMAFPNWDCEFRLTTDPSDKALGTVLEQQRGDSYVSIAHASRALQVAEKHYPTSKNELLAIVWTTETFRDYL